ncbi:MAG: cation:proton antiporter [Deltaproteobacteria bacterium]|nr:cation:proton antiporter [Deltaproteobacteria bacterium]
MSRILGLLAVLALALLSHQAILDNHGAGLGRNLGEAGSAAMALGFVLLVSYLLGGGVRRLGLPSITGYLLVGMTFGPYVLGRVHPVLAILDRETVDTLSLLDSVALGMIALSAGGELKLARVRPLARTISYVIVGQVLLTILGIGALVSLGAAWFPSLAGLSESTLLALAILFAVTACANSPATALAVIQEYRARGPVTDVVLAVTVVKDVVVISLFTLAMGAALLLLEPGSGFDLLRMLLLAWEVVGSIAMGVVLGWLVVQYLARLGHEVPLLVLATSFLAVSALPAIHLSGLLALMVAGFYIENHSPHGDDLIRAIERHSLPVYVVFFTIAGASLNMDALGAALPLALALAGGRIAMVWLGTSLGARFSGAPPQVSRHAWSGFVAQAGVTLGFAMLARQRLPALGGEVFLTGVLAVVAVNQVLGPVLFRAGLWLAGEAKGRK